MDARGIDFKLHAMAGLIVAGGGARASDETVGAGLDVGMGLRAHRLDDVQQPPEALGGGRGSAGDDADILGPDAGVISRPANGLASGRPASFNSMTLRRFLKTGIAGFAQFSADKVHGGIAEATGDKEIIRLEVKADGRTRLLNGALAHDGDALSHRHRLEGVVGGVDHRGLETLVKTDDLRAHPRGHGGVEARKRLLEEERLGLPGDGAAEGNAQAFGAGKAGGFAAERGSRPSMAAASVTRRLISAPGNFRSLRPKAMFSKTLMRG